MSIAETAKYEAVRSPATDAASGQIGFVQLPTDAQRSAAVGYQRAFSGARRLTCFGVDLAATLVGSLCSVLFRYTQQESIDVALFALGRDFDQRVSGILSCSLSANESIRSAIAQAGTGIGSMGDGEIAAAASNIAVSFRGAILQDADTHDVHLIVGDDPGAFEIAYNARLFAPPTIDRLADAIARVFDLAVQAPATPIGDLPIVSRDDLHAIAVAWDSGHARYPQEPVHRIFQRQARERPDAIALRFENRALTYGELDAASNRLAHHLLASGVKSGDAVAVCVMPAVDIVVAFLAIWKAGAVYVPLDPTHPSALIAAILDDVQPRIVLTQSALAGLTDSPGHAQFCFDTGADYLASLPATAPAVNVTLADRAYVLYTSGTTGKPKGVDARHGNLAHYIHVAQQQYGFSREDVFCSLARYTFSISLLELVSPLCCGGSLRLLPRDEVLAPNRLAGWFDQVTVIHAGPSLLGNLFRFLHSSAEAGKTFPKMRHASSGGDLVPPTLLEEMKHFFPSAELFVIYGCTEISCMGCTYPVDRASPAMRTYVGKPFPDVVVRLTDPAGNIVPIGAVGEICFAGKGVVNGYLHRPELTAEKFTVRQGERFYATGDMGRLHADGNVEILGRRDYQVQLRGIRVELPGIENTVRAIGLAQQCAVVVKKLSEQDIRLIAFAVKPRESAIAGFRRALSAHLPDYMLPQALVAIDALPVTRNGKLDRNALQQLPWENVQPPAKAQGIAPRTPLESQIASAFAKALGVDHVGIDDDFFDLGGHSLLAVALVLELEKAGLKLPPGVIFDRPTVRAIAEQAEGKAAHVVRPVPLNDAPGRPALFMVMGVQLYKPLAKRLEADYAVLGVYSGRELLNAESAESFTVAALAGDYIRIIRQQQPAGPYRIGGISFGGVVAYEAAQQLRDAGEAVEFLALMDAVLPESGLRYRMGQIARVLALPPRDMLRVAGDRLHTRFPRLFKSRPKSDFIRYATEEKVGAIEQERMSAYADATFAYAPTIRPYPGRLELIVAGRRIKRDPSLSPTCGWRGRAEALNVHVLDGDHFDLVEEPTVAQVAEIFLRSLRSNEQPQRKCVGYAAGELAELDLSDGVLDPQT